MIYAKCKCGDRSYYSDFGVPRCIRCEKCGSTLGAGPNDHQELQPHRWSEPQWRIDPKSGDRWQERRCDGCFEVERVSTSEVEP